MSIEKQPFFDDLINDLMNRESISPKELNNLKITLAKKHNFRSIVKNAQLLAYANDENRDHIIKLLNNKPVRELSGVTVVALFAKPHSCPHGKCMYCPGGPGSPFGDTPQSYTGTEPAALRAIRNNYDPYLQIFNRLEHYVANGHDPDKLELIFMGGTFPSLDKEYRDEFVYYVYKAINDFGELFFYIDSAGQRKIDYTAFNEFFEMKGEFNSKERELEFQQRALDEKNKNAAQEITPDVLNKEIRKNELAKIRAIGLTIETKPDWALQSHCQDMLRYGCTRLEIGVQTLNENCLRKTNRGHGLQETKDAFQISKDMCFKINAHMMLGLPASTLEIDKQSLIDLFVKQDFRPDMLKIYPCLVVKGTPLFKMYELNLFKPIDTPTAAKIIAQAYAYFPRYVRVMRVQRDIPTTVSEEGIRNSNLREFVDKEMNYRDIKSKDIRAREIGFRQLQGHKMGEFDLKVEEFTASSGKEFFIDVVDADDSLIGFTRLRFPSQSQLMPEITSKTALIRELHIYGQTIPVGRESQENRVQHKGWGRKLIEKAEKIAIDQGYEKMAIISGVGVREYYRKLGYELEGPYMVKKLK